MIKEMYYLFGCIFIPSILLLLFIVLCLRKTKPITVKKRSLDEYTIQKFKIPVTRGSYWFLVARKPSIFQRNKTGKELNIVQDLGDCLLINKVSRWAIEEEHEGIMLKDLLNINLKSRRVDEDVLHHEEDSVFVMQDRVYEFKSNIKLNSISRKKKFKEEIIATLKAASR